MHHHEDAKPGRNLFYPHTILHLDFCTLPVPRNNSFATTKFLHMNLNYKQYTYWEMQMRVKVKLNNKLSYR